MFRAIQRAREEESGFTLIELLIVIVILGILAGVVIFSVGGVTDTGAVAACKTDLKTVQVAVEAYKAEERFFPPRPRPRAHAGATSSCGRRRASRRHAAGARSGYNIVYRARRPGRSGTTTRGAVCPTG